MTTLVVGATGATGRLLVQQLLHHGQHVKAVVRSPDRLPEDLRRDERCTVVQPSVLDLNDTEIAAHLNGCNAVALCLGHTPSFKGIYGPPRWLVTETTRRLCAAIRANQPPRPVRFVLMNTAGNSNRDTPEKTTLRERCALGLIRLLLPPHRDNEQAADHLRTQVGQHDPMIEWAVVRPDTLVNESAVTPYELHAAPTRSAIFDPGRTSRINVGHFMAALITDDALWNQWKGRMPVIYNKGNAAKT